MDQRPAITLATIRRLAHSAERRGTLINPRELLDIIDRRKA